MKLRPIAVMVLGLGLGAAVAAPGDPAVSRDAVKAEKARIAAEYKSDKERWAGSPGVRTSRPGARKAAHRRRSRRAHEKHGESALRHALREPKPVSGREGALRRLRGQLGDVCRKRQRRPRLEQSRPKAGCQM
jgi:hypothetical protein